MIVRTTFSGAEALIAAMKDYLAAKEQSHSELVARAAHAVAQVSTDLRHIASLYETAADSYDHIRQIHIDLEQIQGVVNHWSQYPSDKRIVLDSGDVDGYVLEILQAYIEKLYQKIIDWNSPTNPPLTSGAKADQLQHLCAATAIVAQLTVEQR